jgi:hypothetical protein
VLKEKTFELNDTVVDLSLEERNSDGVVVLAIGQKSAGVWIYTFDGDTLQSQQVMESYDKTFKSTSPINILFYS